MRFKEFLSEEAYKKVPYEKKKLDADGHLIFKYLGKKVPQDVLEICSYIVADKNHVLEPGEADADFDWVFKNIVEKSTVPLYRGIKDKKEIEAVLAGKPIANYTSYSEVEKVAKGFATKKGITITVLPPVKGFKFYEFMTKMRHEDSNGDDEQDDEDIEGYQKEKEWILPFNTVLEVVDKDKLIFKVK